MMTSEARLQALERQVGRQRAVLIALAGIGLGGLLMGVARSPTTIDARAIRIVDGAGRPRILIGAPPPADGRTRKDAQTVSIVVLGPDGHDRLTLGEMPGPNIQGASGRRIAPGYGLVIHDPAGAERGGFGFLDNGRAVAALDRPNGDAVGMMADDKSGWAGVIGMYPSADSGNLHEAFKLGSQGRTTSFSLSDDDQRERARLAVDGDDAPTLTTHAAGASPMP